MGCFCYCLSHLQASYYTSTVLHILNNTTNLAMLLQSLARDATCNALSSNKVEVEGHMAQARLGWCLGGAE